jgi:hypothetical protein
VEFGDCLLRTSFTDQAVKMEGIGVSRYLLLRIITYIASILTVKLSVELQRPAALLLLLVAISQ